MLIGMMGSGKTTTGRAVAERLDWAFLDSDQAVEARTGRTVAEIWKAEGEAAFRALEAHALADALLSTVSSPAVIAAAGGVVLDARNRALLKAHPPVVWLRASLDTLARRVGKGDGRPLLAARPREALDRLMAERYPVYEQVADVVVDVDDLSVEAVVDRVVEMATQ